MIWRRYSVLFASFFVRFRYIHISSNKCLADFREIATDSAFGDLSLYQNLIVAVCFPTSIFMWDFCSDCTSSWSSLFLPFYLFNGWRQSVRSKRF